MVQGHELTRFAEHRQGSPSVEYSRCIRAVKLALAPTIASLECNKGCSWLFSGALIAEALPNPHMSWHSSSR